MKLNRKDFLHRLLMVEPGLSKGGTYRQADCFLFRNGRVYTFNQEIACSLPFDLPKEVEGAVEGKKVIDLLKLLEEEEIEVDFQEQALLIRGKRPRSTIPLEEEITLPVESVELPKLWNKLHKDFTEAVDVVHRCARKRRQGEEADWKKECVHLTTEWMEACDNEKLCRFTLPTGVNEPLLIRGETLKGMSQMGMTLVAETQAWLHFRNPMKLRMSLRKFVRESYPNLLPFLEVRGKKVLLPKSLSSVVQRAMVFSDERIRVSLLPSKVVVEAITPRGSHYESCPPAGYEYNGPPLTFSLAPRLLVDIVQRDSVCEISEHTIRLDNGKYVFVASLEKTP